MNVHKNARLTPAGRAQLVQRVVEHGEAIAVVAQNGPMSKRRLHDWVARYRAAGDAGLQDRSSRPHRSPQRLRRPVRRRIGKLRQARRSSLEIADALALPLSTVVTEQRRQGLNRLPPLQPPPPVVRYERERPGELVHVDTKKLGRFWRPGHRAHGSRRHRNTGAGWEILFVAIDDATRLLYAEVLNGETALTAAGFFERARALFGLHGIVIAGWMTDNGSAFVSRRIRALLAGWHTGHLHTPDQRESRARDSNVTPGVGLRTELSYLGRTPSRPGGVPAILQHQTTAYRLEPTNPTRTVCATQ